MSGFRPYYPYYPAEPFASRSPGIGPPYPGIAPHPNIGPPYPGTSHPIWPCVCGPAQRPPGPEIHCVSDVYFFGGTSNQ